MVNMHFIWGIIFINGIHYFTQADIHELQFNDRAYLPPVKSRANNEYLPPSNNERERNVYSEFNQCQLFIQKAEVNNGYLPPPTKEKLESQSDYNARVKNNNFSTNVKSKVNNENLSPNNKPLPGKISALKHNSSTVTIKTELNQEEYLKPLKEQHNLYKSADVNSEQFSKQLSDHNYQHNQPKVIEDPLPLKVNYIQPLRIDFVDGQYKPISKGALFSGLFLNSSEIKLTTEVILTKNQNLTTKAVKKPSTPNKIVNYELKTDNSLQSENYHKKFEPDIVLINFPDDTSQYKLFNSDDDTELSGSAPVVIFKPGDDISFVEDTSIIDDYEHMPELKRADDSLTTTTPKYSPVEVYNLENLQSESIVEDHLEEEQQTFGSHGYSAHDRPKIKSTRNHVVDALTEKSSEYNISNESLNNQTAIPDAVEFLKEAFKNTSKSKEEDHAKTISAQLTDTKATESSANENESSFSGGGYFYEKPKIPFTF